MNNESDNLAASQGFGHVATVDEIINEAKNGRMSILIDEVNSNRGAALFLPAQMVTPDAINFMATYGRGLIGLALTPERVDILGLQPQSKSLANADRSAFTVSIEARDGVSTGCSPSAPMAQI